MNSPPGLLVVIRPDRVRGKVAPQGSSQVELHGAEHEIALPVQGDASGGQYAVTGHLAVPYVRWGMKNPGALFLRVSDKVDIAIRTVARPAVASTRTIPPRP